MSIASQITRLTTLRNNIRTKLIALGIISDSSATLSDCYDGINGVVARNSSSMTSSSNTVTAPAGYYASAGTKTVGTAKAAATYNTSTSDQTIAAGNYLTGAQTIKAVKTENISSSNIKDGVTITVGDENDADRIAGVAGTFTDASTVSSGQTAAAAGQILSGYSAWVDGSEVKGSIATKTSADMTVSGATVTAPAGYYASSQSKSVANGAIAASATGSATISSLSYSYNSSSGNFGVSGSGNISGTASASVSTAGYVSSSTTGTGSTTGSANVSATVAKIVGSTTITGTTTTKPVISRTSTTATGATNVGSGNASTTKPTAGYFVSVQSAQNTGTLTATPGVTTAGYGTSTNHGLAAGTSTVGASASDVTYITVPSGSASTPATTITAAPTISVSSSGLITATSSATQSVTPTVSAGYVSSGTAGTITVSGSSTNQLSTQAAKTVTPTKSSQTAVAAGKYTTGAVTVDAIPPQYQDVSSVDATASDVRAGKTIVLSDGSVVEGTLSTLTYAVTESQDSHGGTILDITALDLSNDTVSPSTLLAGYTAHDSGGNAIVGTATGGGSGTDTSDATLNSNAQLLSGVTAYAKGTKYTGTIATKTSSDITNSNNVVTIPSGYYASQVQKTIGTAKAAATITPSTSNQTIAAGTYITGVQTIAGDADLVGSNIISTANIFGVQGTVVIQHYYTGSGAPASSLGANGDIYLRTG